jgi:uncharacterized protein YjbI with pentapeptide repeats
MADRPQSFLPWLSRWGLLLTTLLLGWTMGTASAPWAIAPAYAGDYEFTKEILIGADFSNRDLTDASFTKANLRSSNFSQANLQGVSFYGANLEAADLEGANLSGATLDQARMTDANLRNAILEGAYAFNTLFGRAEIEGADFTDVLMRDDAQEQLCQRAKGVNPKTGRATRDTLMCPN